MTMHLMSPAFSTNSTRKRKSKVAITPALLKECKDHNKMMRKLGLKEKSVEDYVAYKQGKYNPKLGGAVKSPTEAKSLQRTTPEIPSNNTVGVGFANKAKEYTGTLIKGIATMHKSNAVPVISKEAAEEISRMRRG